MERNTPRNKTRSNPDMLPRTRLACRFKKRSMTALPMTFAQKHHDGNRHGASSVLVAAPPPCATPLALSALPAHRVNRRGLGGTHHVGQSIAQSSEEPVERHGGFSIVTFKVPVMQ